MGRRESGGKYLRARDLTSAKKLVILSYFPVVQGGECKKLARNILPSATVLPVHCAKKTDTHFSCRARGSYQCKKLARNILTSARVLPVPKPSYNTHFSCRARGSYQCKKLYSEIFFQVQGSYKCKKLAVHCSKKS